MKTTVNPTKWRMLSVVLGGILTQIVIGTVYTYGNLNPYITSYMRYTGSAPTLTYTECSWIYVGYMCSQALFMSSAGFVERKLGIRWATLLGSWILSLGVLLTYFTIQHSFGAVVFTSGIMCGMGAGIAYTPPMSCAMKWMSNNPGFASGLVNAGIGGGALIFNSVETSFINPDNKKVTLEVDGETYFDQKDIIEKVPYLFLLLGGIFAAMQLVGALLLSDPPTTKIESIVVSREKEGNHLVLEEDDTTPLLGHRKQDDLSMSNKMEDKEEDGGLHPLQVIQTLDFWLFFFIFFFNGLAIVFLNALYKAFGLSFINDDVFLSLVGTASAPFNAAGRIFWGYLADRISFKVTTMIMNTVFICLMLTLQVTQLTNKFLFMVYICLLLGTGVGTFTLIPTAVSKRFGRKHVTTNYGMVFWSQLLTAPLSVAIAETLENIIGWTGLFFIIAGLYGLGFILAFVFNAKDKEGKDI